MANDEPERFPILAMTKVSDACSDLPSRYRLEILGMVWLTVARESQIDVGLVDPGAVQAELAWQVAWLRKALGILESDTLDLALERRVREILDKGDRE